jgi:hypothetical protein
MAFDLADGPILQPGPGTCCLWFPGLEGNSMKWMNVYFIGFLIFLAGVTLALWKAGIIEQIGTGWTAIGLVIAIGIGVMVSVANSGEKKTIEVDHS